MHPALACRRLDLHVIHHAYVGSLVVFLVLQPIIRDNGGRLFWAFAAVTILYVLITARLTFVPPLFGFTLVGLVYIAFSYLDALPDAWTTQYQPAEIPRQAFYVILFYPMVLAALSLWSYAASSRNTFRLFVVILITTAGIAPLIEGVFSHSGMVTTYAAFATGGLGNARLLMLVALAYLLLVRTRFASARRLWTLTAVGVMVAAAVHFIPHPQYQNFLALLVLVLFLYLAPRRRIVIALVLVALVAYCGLVRVVDRVYEQDANTGYRLATSRDAMIALAESYGVGVGFGKEVVTGKYDELGFRRDPSAGGRYAIILQGTHNSFAQEYMRLGLVGGSFIAWFFLVTCLPPHRGPLDIRRHLAVVYFLLFISIISNVALQSPTYIVGVAIAVGYILVTKDWLRLTGEQGDDAGNWTGSYDGYPQRSQVPGGGEEVARPALPGPAQPARLLEAPAVPHGRDRVAPRLTSPVGPGASVTTCYFATRRR